MEPSEIGVVIAVKCFRVGSQDPSFVSTHVTACRDAVTSGADHPVGGQDAPPVGLRADVVADHRQKSLLQDVW